MSSESTTSSAAEAEAAAPAPAPPPPTIIDPNSRRWSESYKDKLIRKTTENPFVPIGTAITTVALVMSAVRLRQGNSRKFQVWLRYRVAFQALTIFAILGGIYKYGQSNLEENQRVIEQLNARRAEREMAKEREGLERRIAEAAIAQEEEESGVSMLRKKILKQNAKENAANGSGSGSGGILSMVSWPKWGTATEDRPRDTEKSVSEPPKVSSSSPPPSPFPPSGPKSSWWNPYTWGKTTSSPAPDTPPSKKDS
ncbi:hypothetical protein D9757_007474 [Collybiopsis confluens]|uniref:HIG1 domain-containing protein n=1 Tax=Collybiopsis confluens TaxID=2823264 RepID=A0A8H5M7Y8_9AGAR|nr:hypothetical protein D9757_007474 [Collybiopsis confluens]